MNIQVFTDRESWLKARTGHVGGSEIAAIMGLSNWATPLDVYLRKIGEAQPTEDNEAMEWGRTLEPVIIRKFFQRHPDVALDEESFGRLKIVTNANFPRLAVSPDYFDGSFGLECKLTSRRESDFADDWVPDEYMAQCQANMMATGLQSWQLVILSSGIKMVEVAVRASPEWQKNIADRVTEFWGMFERRQPPIAQAGDKDNVSGMFPPNGGSAPMTAELVALVEQFDGIREEEKAVAAKKDATRNQIVQLLGGASAAKGSGWSVTWKKQSRDGYVVQPSEFSMLSVRKCEKE